VYEDLVALEESSLRRRSLRSDASVVVRSLVSALLTRGRDGRAEPRPFVVSTQVDNVSVAEALDLVHAPAPSSRARMIYFAHAHALTLARFDAGLATLFAKADVVLPDGIGVRLAAALAGTAIRANVNGTDLFPLVCERAAREGVPVVLVGGAPGVASTCATRMRERTPGLEIPLVSHGFLSESDIAALRQQLGELGRCIVLVGMGSPLQERWAHENLADLGGVTVLTVGGLFDFFSGRIPRAPAVMREMGLEWMFRLLCEPKRLARRYLLGNPLFLGLAMWDRARALLSGPPSGRREAPRLTP
jgi:N-acetylglucosaminyldiphosphoundecaprenol N-acetyl-beta-D-mannosaminyltransferase